MDPTIETLRRALEHAEAYLGGLETRPVAATASLEELRQGLVRLPDPREGAGEAFFGPTTWRGRRAMRVSAVNWRTGDSDVQRAIAAVAATLAGPGVSPGG